MLDVEQLHGLVALATRVLLGGGAVVLLLMALMLSRADRRPLDG
ncbi:MAG TPA: hypothetical protein VE596_11320 [Gaiellaceae bacterium]|jgi:hypothetical protein|nr:hypothetical protein [Gaiellaceae bacterium]